jgi:hypothetical protein
MRCYTWLIKILKFLILVNKEQLEFAQGDAQIIKNIDARKSF